MSRFGFLPAAVWRRLPVDLTFHVDVPGGETLLYRSTPNDAIYWRSLQGHEAETVGPFLEIARHACVVFDVGANTGIFSLLAGAVNPMLQVVAFEPLPRLCDAVRANVHLNGWPHRVRVLAEAVSDRVGTAPFHVPRADVPTSASLNQGGFRGLDGDIISVPATRLDATLGSDMPVDLVKVDVEGFEDRVLKGMFGILSRWRPATVVECNPHGPHCDVEQILGDELYVFYHLGPRGPERKPHPLPDDTERCRNYLCLPIERSARFGA